MRFRSFNQLNNRGMIAVNMELVEAILPYNSGSILQLTSTDEGEEKRIFVTDNFRELIASLP